MGLECHSRRLQCSIEAQGRFDDAARECLLAALHSPSETITFLRLLCKPPVRAAL